MDFEMEVDFLSHTLKAMHHDSCPDCHEICTWHLHHPRTFFYLYTNWNAVLLSQPTNWTRYQLNTIASTRSWLSWEEWLQLGTRTWDVMNVVPSTERFLNNYLLSLSGYISVLKFKKSNGSYEPWVSDKSSTWWVFISFCMRWSYVTTTCCVATCAFKYLLKYLVD